jgi:hypothetical protein
MPSRLRFSITTPRDVRFLGAQAMHEFLRGLDSARSWPKVDWRAVHAEGRERGLWTALHVWRERRGIQNSQSEFHRAVGRHASHSPEMKLARRAAVNRREAAERPRRLQRLTYRSPGLALGEVAPTERRIRPGIFA